MEVEAVLVHCKSDQCSSLTSAMSHLKEVIVSLSMCRTANGLVTGLGARFIGKTGAEMNIKKSTVTFEGKNTFSDNLDSGIASSHYSSVYTIAHYLDLKMQPAALLKKFGGARARRVYYHSQFSSDQFQIRSILIQCACAIGSESE